MKKTIISSAISLVLLLTSCGTLSRISRETISAPIVYSTRDDISVTNDIEAKGKVETISVLFIDFYKWEEDKRQLKVGPFRFLDKNYNEGVFSGYNGLNSTFDEKIATYNFISENPDLDYVTNVRYKKDYIRKPFYWKVLNIGKREVETTIIAKGIILKNKVEPEK